MTDFLKDACPKIMRLELTPMFIPFREIVKKAMSQGQGGLGEIYTCRPVMVVDSMISCK